MTDNPPVLIKGISCPHCKGPTVVRKIYRPCPGRNARTRQCVKCHARFMTDERPRLPAPPQPHDGPKTASPTPPPLVEPFPAA